ncbi:MAG: PhzF family phenazine biosynthesis protein [Alcaligenes sp.]
MQVKFKQVDVFANTSFKGNPVAVVLDATGLTESQMQGIANWTNVSETTFVSAATNPAADYKIKIFTPTSELPFAGHPTIGTAHALIEAGIVQPKNGWITQQCEVGLIPILVERESNGSTQIFFELPKAEFTELNAEEIQRVQDILGTPALSAITPRFVNVGPIHTVVQLPTAQDVLALTPKLDDLHRFSKEHGTAGIVVFGAQESRKTSAIEARSFFPILGINEDPVCGSGNGAIAAFIAETQQTSVFGNHFSSSQGQALGREGKIALRISPDTRIQVGGESVTTIDGLISI